MMAGDAVARVIDSVRSGDIASAIDLARALPLDELHQAVLGEAFDHQSVACYVLYVGLLVDQESAERHVAASELLSLALNIFPGAYGAALFHARRAVTLAPEEVSYKEHLLSFHNNPESLLSAEDVRRVAHEVLGRDPSNEAAHAALRTVDDSEST